MIELLLIALGLAFIILVSGMMCFWILAWLDMNKKNP